MQLSQYNAVGDTERSCEKVMDSLMPFLRDAYDYIIIDCGLKHELLTVNALAASDYCIIRSSPTFSPVKASRMCWIWCVLSKRSLIRAWRLQVYC